MFKKLIITAAAGLAAAIGTFGASNPASATDAGTVTNTISMQDTSLGRVRVITCNVNHGTHVTEADNRLVRAWAFVSCPAGNTLIDGGIYIYQNGVRVGYGPLRGTRTASVVGLAPCVPGGRYTAAVSVRVSAPGAIPAAGTYWYPTGVTLDCK